MEVLALYLVHGLCFFKLFSIGCVGLLPRTSFSFNKGVHDAASVCVITVSDTNGSLAGKFCQNHKLGQVPNFHYGVFCNQHAVTLKVGSNHHGGTKLEVG